MVELKEYFEHPELLDGLSMEDISEQMQEYPASTRLRWLWMLKKQRIAGEPLKDLRLAWMHAPEMTSFHEVFQSGDSGDFYLEMESIEEKTEGKDESDNLSEPSVVDKVESNQEAMDERTPPSRTSREKDRPDLQANDKNEKESLDKFRMSGSQSSGNKLEEEPAESDFLLWLLQKKKSTPEQGPSAEEQTSSEPSEEIIAESRELEPEPEPEEVKQDTSKEEKEALQAAIKKSIEEDEDILSPTLAEVLAEQGHIQRAIDMYEKLRLVYPDKSSFFAEKIEQLKNQ